MGNTISLDTAIERWHSQENFTVLLLGTSLQIKHSYNGSVRVASRRSRDNQTSRADGNLEGILLDLENMRRNLLSDVPAGDDKKSLLRLHCDIYNVWNQQRHQGKKEMLDAIRDFFHQVKRNFILYYSGHGEEGSGNWAIGRPDSNKVETVSLEDLLSLWRRSPSSDYKRLLIVSDSCHSGAWVDKLERMQRINVSMMASCKAGETCTDTIKGGDFTRSFLKEREEDAPPLGFQPTATKDINLFALIPGLIGFSGMI